MDIKVEISDEILLNSNFGNKPWFYKENRIIPITKKINENGYPNIEYYSFRNLKRNKDLSFPFRREFERRQIEEFRCFYTNVKLYITTSKLNNSSWKIVPWALTREHVASRRNNNLIKVNTIGNIVPCSKMLNKMMAHAPLIIKLYEREKIKSFNFNRDDFSSELSFLIKDKIIHEIEKTFKFEGNYPWFSHVYVGTKFEEVTKEFFGALKAYEDEFLSWEWKRQRDYLYAPLDVDVVDLAKKILGLKISCL